MTPRATALRMERRRTLPRGRAERFTGYGVLGVTFDSGHMLSFRRYPSSSIGPAFTSVWHRDPAGRWTFHVDAPADQSCPRYFGPAVQRIERGPVEIEWSATHTLAVHVPHAGLHWSLRLGISPMAMLVGTLARLTPDAVWRGIGVGRLAGPVAGSLLGAGLLCLGGSVPAGHRFSLHPTHVWHVAASTARLGTDDLGTDVIAASAQRLGDFVLPRRALFAAGSVSFWVPASSRAVPTPA